MTTTQNQKRRTVHRTVKEGSYTQQEFAALAQGSRPLHRADAGGTSWEVLPDGQVVATQNAWPSECGVHTDHPSECDCVLVVGVYPTMRTALRDPWACSYLRS